MKPDKIHSYFPEIPIESASRDPIGRNLTNSRLDPIQIFWALQDPTEWIAPGPPIWFLLGVIFLRRAVSLVRVSSVDD